MLKVGKRCYTQYEEVKYPIAVRGSKLAGYVAGKKFYPRGKAKIVRKC